MIRLTRLNSSEIIVNSDLIEFVELTPDTVISLTTGEKILVRESAEEILEKIIEFKRLIFVREIPLKLNRAARDEETVRSAEPHLRVVERD